MNSIQISSLNSESIVKKCREVFSHGANICGKTGNVQLDYNVSRKGQCGDSELYLEDVNSACRQGDTERVSLPRLVMDTLFRSHVTEPAAEQHTMCTRKQTNVCICGPHTHTSEAHGPQQLPEAQTPAILVTGMLYYCWDVHWMKTK